MKKCSACGKEKQSFDFQIRRLSPDGLTASCKSCLRERDAARYPKEKVKRSALHKAYASGAGKEIVSACKERWASRNAAKRAAHTLVNNAIRNGRLKKEPCARCGATRRIHGHHEDYMFPLSVTWLCPTHHKERHREMLLEGISP